jgi:hypothetical protein
MQQNNDVTLTIIQNLPAILTALTPIIASITAVIISIMSNRKSKANTVQIDATNTKLAETKSVTNRVIAVTKALRDNATRPGAITTKSKVFDDNILADDPVEIPELPEPLQ